MQLLPTRERQNLNGSPHWSISNTTTVGRSTMPITAVVSGIMEGGFLEPRTLLNEVVVYRQFPHFCPLAAAWLVPDQIAVVDWRPSEIKPF